MSIGALTQRLLDRTFLRTSSGLVLLAFVTCHLLNHCLILVSIDLANAGHEILIRPWRTLFGTALLVLSALVHSGNALWSLYERRTWRLPPWMAAQLLLGLSIPALLALHLADTRLSHEFLKTDQDYYSLLIGHWVVLGWMPVLQIVLLLTVWTHACIGLHFWLRNKPGYPRWRPLLFAVAMVLPSLALAGYVAGGNEMRRLAIEKPAAIRDDLDGSNIGPETWSAVVRLATYSWTVQLCLLALPLLARAVRQTAHRLARPPVLTHSSGRSLAMLPGATVLEVLIANGIPHASVCGGRGRCTTCRVRVVAGLDLLPDPGSVELRALNRLHTPPQVRLACQIRPTADLSVIPLLAAGLPAHAAIPRGGLAGSEQEVTVMFVDLRGSTKLGESKMPYDVLFILNQFFSEMTAALQATRGHYATFTGDGLMAIYGLDGGAAADGVTDALRGATDMTGRLAALNRRLAGELPYPLRMGIGIHTGEAIVGHMGPPQAQSVSAIGDTVNTTARLESLTKDYSCLLILSRHSADLAGMRLSEDDLHEIQVKGREQPVQFYALREIPEPNPA